MRYFIIGDIHGCYDQLTELENLLKKSYGEPGTEDQIIFLGDYIDRGPKSFEVWEHLEQLRRKYPKQLTLILGNHEHMCCDSPEDWDINGNEYTLQSFRSHGTDIEEYRRWVRKNLALGFESDDFRCCHGDITEKIDFDHITDDDYFTLIWGRSAVETGRYGGPLTFIGHTPLKTPAWFGPDEQGNGSAMELKYGELYQLPKTGVIDLDTACVYGSKYHGRLTAAVIENGSFRLFSVENPA